MLDDSLSLKKKKKERKEGKKYIFLPLFSGIPIYSTAIVTAGKYRDEREERDDVTGGVGEKWPM